MRNQWTGSDGKLLEIRTPRGSERIFGNGNKGTECKCGEAEEMIRKEGV